MSEGAPAPIPRWCWAAAAAVLCLLGAVWIWGKADPQAWICWEARKPSRHWIVPSQPDMEPRTPLDPWGHHLEGDGPAILRSGPSMGREFTRYYTSATRLWSLGPNGRDERGGGDDIEVLKPKAWPGRVVAYALARVVSFALLLFLPALLLLVQLHRTPPRSALHDIGLAMVLAALVTIGLYSLVSDLDWLLTPFAKRTLLVPPILAKGLTVGLFSGASVLYALHVRRKLREEQAAAAGPSPAEGPDTPRPPDAGGA